MPQPVSLQSIVGLNIIHYSIIFFFIFLTLADFDILYSKQFNLKILEINLICITMPSDNKDLKTEKSDSVWYKLLHEKADNNSSNSLNSTILCVGLQNSGQNDLFSSFGCEETSFDNKDSISNYPQMLSYQYFKARDPSDDLKNTDNDGPMINLWNVTEESIHMFPTSLIESTYTDQLLILICIDVSNKLEDNEIILRKWIHYALKCKESWTINDKNKNVPIVVAACKADKMSAGKVGALKELNLLQGSLRGICLAAKASLTYINNINGNNNDDNNNTSSDITMIRLYEHVLDLMVPDLFGQEKKSSLNNLQSTSSDVFIPGGVDSVELIKAATDVVVDLQNIKTLIKDSEKTDFPIISLSSSSLSSKGNDSVDTESDKKTIKVLEDEQLWLGKLRGVIEESSANESSSSSFTTGSGITSSSSGSDLNETANATSGTATGTKAPDGGRVTRSRLKPNTQPKKDGSGSEATDFFKSLLGK